MPAELPVRVKRVGVAISQPLMVNYWDLDLDSKASLWLNSESHMGMPCPLVKKCINVLFTLWLVRFYCHGGILLVPQCILLTHYIVSKIIPGTHIMEIAFVKGLYIYFCEG